MDTQRLTVNCSILLTDTPLLQRPRAARDAGFDAVEFWWPFDTAVPTDRDVEAFIGAVSDAGVRLTHLNFAAGNIAAGERGLLSHPHTSSEFRDSVAIAVAIGERLGTVGFNALYGNRIDGLGPEIQDALAVENLAFAGNAVASIGAQVLLEPISGVPSHPLKRAADAVAVIEQVRSEHAVENIRLLADLYHLASNGEDVPDVLATHADLVGHVQIADAPGRGEPGTGTLDLAGYLDAAAAHGYHGWISLEYIATRRTTFDWVPDFPTRSHP
ncbi:hydroxypyruvate isomerase family protein [Gordonia sp. NPDC003424]